MDFLHLRMYSEYSIEKSINKIDKIIDKYISDNQNCAVLTDINNLFASVYFYENCYKKNIKPILGCEILIKNEKNIFNPFKLLLLIKNKLGYFNLSKLLSRASIYNNLKIKNNIFFINKNWLKKSFNKGLILLSGGEDGEIIKNLYQNDFNLSIKSTKFWSKYFKNRFYIEIQKFYLKKNYNKELLYLSSKLKLPIIATHNIFFLNKNEFITNKLKTCIYKNIKLYNYNNKFDFSKNNFFIPKKKMINFFKKFPSSLRNTIEISKKCNLILNLKKIKLPFFKINKLNNNINLIKLILLKLKIFIKKKYQYSHNFKYKIYKNRALNECKVIISMGLTDYFLIVNDFIKWSKKKKIIIGPGRGSSAGSLVAFLLNITSLDPIKYNLLFERFLNLERISMPDFDIDFPQSNREKIMNYVKYKYGINNVSQIITFGKMASKAAIRDVGRVLNFNYNFIDEIVKLIPFKLNINNNIKDIIKNNLILKKRYNKELEIKNILKFAYRIEGIIKNLGSHAGGLLISHNKIFNICPILYQNNIIISQFEKDSSELIGILKFDFLALTTLNIISKSINKIKKKFLKDFFLINLKDKLCFLNIKKANTDSVFQLESNGMKSMLIKANPDCFENIIALISLYRPGPIELLNSFCLRKIGKEKIIYIDNRLKNILKETYGIIIYQEQVMEIVKIIGNFNLNKADILRRAISKKNYSEIKNQKFIFFKGAAENNLNKKKTIKIFNLIKKFSGYGFNKSHAAAYSVISYYTIWLKTYYIDDFMCSNLSYSMNDIKKIENLIKDSVINNIYILPININKSNYNFLNINEKFNKIRYGFGAIKGLGYIVIREILRIRKKKFFKSIEDFYVRSNKNIINYRIIEILICSGSFDNICNNRAYLLESFIKIKNSLNIKNKIFYKNFIFKKNYIKYIYKLKINLFWNFKTKIFEELIKIGYFILNSLYNIYKYKIEKIFNKKYYNNENIIFGVLIKIDEKSNIDSNYFILYLLNNLNKLEIKININIYNENKKFIKIYNFLFIFKENYKIKKILDINSFIKYYVKNKTIS